jgi:archaemetzincin
MDKPLKSVFLHKIGNLNHKIIQCLKRDLDKRFLDYGLSIKINKERMPLLESEYNRMRKQYDGSKILRRLFDLATDKQYFRNLGVLDVDIFSRGLNFVFGIATPPNNKLTNNFGVSIISLTRLREAFYGHDENPKIFRLRTLKEAVHELGHTLGLKHCDNHCIMRFSNHLRETDHKPVKFCESCEQKVENYLNKIKFES